MLSCPCVDGFFVSALLFVPHVLNVVELEKHLLVIVTLKLVEVGRSNQGKGHYAPVYFKGGGEGQLGGNGHFDAVECFLNDAHQLITMISQIASYYYIIQRLF